MTGIREMFEKANTAAELNSLFSKPRMVMYGTIIGERSSSYLLVSPNGGNDSFAITESEESKVTPIERAEDIIWALHEWLGWKEFKRLGLRDDWLLVGPIHYGTCRKLFVNVYK